MDPVFIAAYLLNPIIYFRNVYFIHRRKKGPLFCAILKENNLISLPPNLH
jgi:hypothetical protein